MQSKKLGSFLLPFRRSTSFRFNSTERPKFLKNRATKPSQELVPRQSGALLMGLPGMVQQARELPPPQDPNSANDVPSSRVKLSDGRFLAYIERGVPKSVAKYKIVIVHGFGSSKETKFLAPQELIDELKIYFLLFDRAGYGESDPNPKRSLKSEANDIQQLADQLQIGSKFYLIGVSMGSYPVWSCLKYIPHRLASVAFVVPVINYKWPSLPRKLINGDYRKNNIQWALRIANYAPRLLHWWVIQKWFPSTSILERNPFFFNRRDIEVLKKTTGFPMLTREKLQEKDVFDTLRSDFMVAFGSWDFDPLELGNPFPENESSVHIWQGFEDKVVPFQLQRFVSEKLPWIRYHEVPDGGHLLVHYNGLCESILRALLLGEEPLQCRPSVSLNAA